MTVDQYIKRAITLLQQGGLVAFPTETVYGLGADAANPEAVSKIFTAKGRPHDHPLIVHVAEMGMLQDWAREVSPQARILAQRFWPGPLTMLFLKQHQVLPILTGGQDTIGIRMPRHPVAQQLLRAFGRGIAAPSANKFTHISPTHAAAVREELGEQVDLILDGGDCEVGLESTIIDMSGAVPVILRPGMITAAAIEKVLGMQLASRSTQRTPGMHPLHYAPRTPTVLLNSEEMRSDTRQDGTALLKRADVGMDPEEYARNLYRMLRELDNQEFARIIIEEVPSTPEWEAIRDRLAKACARD